MSTTLRLDITGALQASAGRRDGISEAQIGALQNRTRRIHETLKRRRQAGELVVYDLPYMRESIIEVMSFAGEQIGRFENYVHIGSGPSTHGPRALHSALNHPFHNFFSAKDRGGYPRLFFVDNFDPDTLNGLLAIIDPRETLFNVVSKTGASTESIASFLFFLTALKKRLGYAWNRQVIFTTHPEDGDLRAVARSERIKTFAIHPMVSKRFLLLTPVGLLPAAFSGIDVHGLLHGAIEMDGACRSNDVMKNPAYLFGATHFLLDTLKGKRQAVMLPSIDCLQDFALWFESLWKRPPRNLGFGNEPFIKLPSTRASAAENISRIVSDEGNEKVFTLLSVERYRHAAILPVEFQAQKSFQPLTGKTAEEILERRQNAITEALISRRQPSLRLTFPAVRPETVGEFIYMMQAAAVYAGELHQPADLHS